MKNLSFICLVAIFYLTACGGANYENKAAYSYKSEADASTQSRSMPNVEAQAAPAAGSGEIALEGNEDSRLNQTGTTVSSGQIETAKKIVKTANIEFQVQKFEEDGKAIKALCGKYKADITNESQQSESYKTRNYLTIRIANDQFDSFIEELMALSVYTDQKNISTDDKTMEYVDIDARLKTKLALEARYREILEVESQIGQIRAEIESAQSRLNEINRSVARSTIHLTYYQKLDYKPQPTIGFFGKLLQALENGWRGFLELIIGLVNIWPLIILTFLGVWLIRAFLRRRSAKKLKLPTTNNNQQNIN